MASGGADTLAAKRPATELAATQAPPTGSNNQVSRVIEPLAASRRISSRSTGPSVAPACDQYQFCAEVVMGSEILRSDLRANLRANLLAKLHVARSFRLSAQRFQTALVR